MARTTRYCATCAGALLLGCLALLAVGPAASQPPTDAPPPDLTSLGSSLFVPADPDLQRKLAAIPEYVSRAAWAEAVRSLQPLFDDKEDRLVPVQRPEGVSWTTARAEAERLLAQLPALGLEYYEVSQGPRARTMLRDAQQRSDTDMLAEVARRYLHTRAGARALSLLASHHLDRGRFIAASIHFRRLLRSAQLASLPPLTLYQAAMACHRSGDREGTVEAWKRLEQAAPFGVRIWGKALSLIELRELLEMPPPRTPSEIGTATVRAPAAEPAWQRSTTGEAEPTSWLQRAASELEKRGQPVIASTAPLLVRGQFVYRSNWGLHGVDPRTGAERWKSYAAGSLDYLAGANNKHAYVHLWIGSYLGGQHWRVLFENSLIGSLTTDGTYVYTVDDVAIPPWPSNYAAFAGRAGEGLDFRSAEPLNDVLTHSKLLALNPVTGKIAWLLGGPSSDKATGPLRDAFFLGPPLPLGERLYVVAEKQQDLRLYCLDPAKKGEVCWSQLLAAARTRLLLDGGRRLHAIQPAYAEGILVCPTNAGAVVAVDLSTRNLLWARPYREEPPPPPPIDMGFRGRFRQVRMTAVAPPNLQPQWRATAPLIAEGKVVFTAPDDASIHCLDLRDGRILWQWPRYESDLYLAGAFTGKVVLVGRDGVRALALEDGKALWRVTTGAPLGQGVLVDGTYHLPVKLNAEGTTTGICVVDLEKGTVAEEPRATLKGPVGNLVYADGLVLSQTPMAVTVYPLTTAEQEP